MKNNEVTIVRDVPVTVKNTNVPATPAAADELRQIYLNKVNFFMKKLQRSVCKEYDPAPSPESFQKEVELQDELMKQILFLQRCRAAIEDAVVNGRGEAWGEKTLTAFVRQEDGLIQVLSAEK